MPAQSTGVVSDRNPDQYEAMLMQQINKTEQQINKISQIQIKLNKVHEKHKQSQANNYICSQ